MFEASLISLADGQSYENAKILESTDLLHHDIPQIFEQWTGCIIAGNNCIMVHHTKIKVILLDRQQRRSPNGINIDQVVMAGDIVYGPATIIHEEDWTKLGIPHFFVKRGGTAGQFVISCKEGTILTHDENITSLVTANPLLAGITKSDLPVDTPLKLAKASAIPDTTHGRISR